MLARIVVLVAMACLCACTQEREVSLDARLGEALFFDPVLSLEQDRACATCHIPGHDFGGPPRAPGEVSVPTLRDVARQKRLGRANPLVARLEDQTRIALFGEEPVEMGMSGAERELVARFSAHPRYCEELLGGVFWRGECEGGERDAREVSKRVIAALSAYQRTLEFPRDTLVDRWRRGEASLEPQAMRGAQVFYGEGRCASCHSGELYADAYHDGAVAGGGAPLPRYVRVAAPGPAARPLRLGRGVQAVTMKQEDYQRVKVPTLRGIARRGYYFHDARRVSLTEAIAWHAPHLSRDEHAWLARFIEGLE